MSALVNLEFHRMVPLLRFQGLLIIFALLSPLMPEGGTLVAVAILATISIVTISRIFPFDGPDTYANVLIGTLPVARRQVVVARFVMALLLVCVTACVVVIILSDLGLTERLGVTVAFMVMPLLSLAVASPMSSSGKFGQIGALVPRLPFLAIVIVAVLLPQGWQQSAISYVTRQPGQSATVVTVVLALSLVASFVLSARWFERRDL